MSAVPNVSIYGVGGEARFRATVLKEITFGPSTDKNLQLAVVGSQHGQRQGKAALVLGVTGLAGNPIDVWTGTFRTIALGDENVRNVKLQIADLFTADTQETTGSHIHQRVEGLPEMLVGADFFRTHRILVLFAERKLVFTYNGGPIFQTIERMD